MADETVKRLYDVVTGMVRPATTTKMSTQQQQQADGTLMSVMAPSILESVTGGPKTLASAAGFDPEALEV